MHHDIVVTVDWAIRVVSGLIRAGLGVFAEITYMRSNFYYFEVGYVLTNTIAQFMTWGDWVFHFDYITPSKPWNRYDPDIDSFHGHEIYQTDEPHTINKPI